MEQMEQWVKSTPLTSDEIIDTDGTIRYLTEDRRWPTTHRCPTSSPRSTGSHRRGLGIKAALPDDLVAARIPDDRSVGAHDSAQVLVTDDLADRPRRARCGHDERDPEVPDEPEKLHRLRRQHAVGSEERSIEVRHNAGDLRHPTARTWHPAHVRDCPPAGASGCALRSRGHVGPSQVGLCVQDPVRILVTGPPDERRPSTH